jgi:hypothetical protein
MTRRKVLVLVAAIVVLLPGYVGYQVYRPRVQVDACRDCLPKPLTLETEFCEFERDSGQRDKAITIHDKLIQLGAYCERGKIYDRTGREVRFYWRRWGFGFPLTPEQERLFEAEQADHNARVKKMRERYTVVEMWPTRLPE